MREARRDPPDPRRIALELVSLRDAGLPVPNETEDTFHDKRAQKATTCARQSGLWTLADDSGLCVDALDGAPGVHSARYAPTDSERRSKLLAAPRASHSRARSAFLLRGRAQPADGGASCGPKGAWTEASRWRRAGRTASDTIRCSSGRDPGKTLRAWARREESPFPSRPCTAEPEAAAGAAGPGRRRLKGLIQPRKPCTSPPLFSGA